jgi:hypothetical protein
MAIEWQESDAEHVGLMYDKALLKTDPEKGDRIRRGTAILEVFDAVLEQIFKDLEDNDDSAEA